ncbi:unnamed protein product [Brassica oleracea var. botrytis]|uniref:(rape) hypothetical protein n=1 Tax=Brassica napus TaxID=3708 RepID=A0A816J917_BRANA|nr:unnamed protein product [Brassica napus]
MKRKHVPDERDQRRNRSNRSKGFDGRPKCATPHLDSSFHRFFFAFFAEKNKSSGYIHELFNKDRCFKRRQNNLLQEKKITEPDAWVARSPASIDTAEVTFMAEEDWVIVKLDPAQFEKVVGDSVELLCPGLGRCDGG